LPIAVVLLCLAAREVFYRRMIDKGFDGVGHRRVQVHALLVGQSEKNAERLPNLHMQFGGPLVGGQALVRTTARTRGMAALEHSTGNLTDFFGERRYLKEHRVLTLGGRPDALDLSCLNGGDV